MKTLLLTLLAMIGLAVFAPTAQARDYYRHSYYGHSYSRPYYYGHRSYYGRPYYGHSYYRGYYPRYNYYRPVRYYYDDYYPHYSCGFFPGVSFAFHF